MLRIGIRDKKTQDIRSINSLDTQPVSRLFAYDRGLSIDRFFIERFLSQNKDLITGTVLENGDNNYTKKFGDKDVKSMILHPVEAPDVDIVGDLGSGKGIPENLIDCFICTQTLLVTYDLKEVVKNTIKVLKPGGYLMITVPGITQISRYDMDRWGHYWSFTDLSLRKLYEEVVPAENIKIESFGNVKLAAAFLYGLAKEDLKESDFEYNDPDYQVTITALIQKPLK